MARSGWWFALTLALFGCGVGAGAGGDGPRGGGDGGPKADGASRTYSCATPEWNDEDWLKHSGCYYVVDVRDQYFNNWCYRVGSCTKGQLPPNTTLDTWLKNHDDLALLASLQGLVNRDRANLYVIADEQVDESWITALTDEQIWFHELRRVDVGGVEEALALFRDHPALAGSVSWRSSEPFTMNIAFSVAGAENLLVVREGSALEDAVTADFPLAHAFGGMFESKRAGYEWLIDNYVKTGKLAPILTLAPDGWPVYTAEAGNLHEEGWGLVSRDVFVARKTMQVAYGVNALGPDPYNPAAPKGEGRAVIDAALAAMRARVGSGVLLEAGGWPGGEYSFDCNNDGMITSADNVSCEEWEWVKLLSQKGAMLRTGGPGLYAKESANTSFWVHGPGADLVVHPLPELAKELLTRGHVFGPPRNHSFELGDTGWALTATNRTVYNEAANASHGSRFLQMNVTAGDVGKGAYQDITVPLAPTFRYKFTIRARAASSGTLAGRQRVTTGGGATVLCNNAFTLTGSDWKTLECEFQVTGAAANVRVEVALDTADKNYAFDEAYLLGSTTFEVNGLVKYATFYMGDYDFTNALTVFPLGVHPRVWTTLESDAATAWSMASDARLSIPPIFAYLAKTKSDKMWFVMPDSGAGYLNPGFLPAEYRAPWVKESARMQRPVGYRAGWVLNGTGSGEVPKDNAMGDNIRAMYRIIAPDGIYYNNPVTSARRVDGGMPVLPLESSRYAGQGKEAAGAELKASLDASPSPFNVFRTVFISNPQVDEMVANARGRGAVFEVVDPITLSYLYRQAEGAGTIGRMSVVAHTLPSTLRVGESTAVSVTVRNDGWEAWQSTPLSGSACDGSATAGKACERFAWGLAPEASVTPTGLGAAPSFLYPGRIPFESAVYPGETATLSFELTAPDTPGTYTFQCDGVKELVRFFETAGNVPWQKSIVVE